ncbi:hypothetical protein LCGC14_1904750 [marine sediment metagenome]|uniref:GIY-YIG domain-containing protein n=1 Tax=marine sediment metagenome TaxID=412755 RepID=A0A0F9FVV7_9ZZZZ
MDWSNWENIENLPDYEGKGVYRFRLVDNKGKCVSIPRFLGEDKDGIIVIGEAENIKTRLNQFNKVVTESKKYAHSEGLTIHLLRKITKFKEIYGMCTFQYTFIKVDEHKEAEKKLLENYFEDYGETPPLNYKREFISSKGIRDSYF